jgi:hypothetical protein
MPIDTLDEFIDAFETRLRDAGLQGKVRTIFSGTDSAKLISLDLIEVEPEHRNRGLSGAALRLMCDLADECGFAIEVIPKRIEGPMTDEQLVAWYTRHVFRVTRMRRDPRR